MPSRRDRETEKSLERDRSRSPGRAYSLPSGVDPISEKDYFLKSDEFRVWLKDEKGKYFDELSGDRARSYFRKFVKAWNRGKLSKTLYSGVNLSAQSATNQTAYKWSFGPGVSSEALRAVREEVGSATYGRDLKSQATSSSKGANRVHGPTLPSASDLVLAREAASEYQAAERDYKRKRDRTEAKERVEDMVGPKPVGREAMLEKKRARRENDKNFREKGDDGFEADESTLLGGGDSFRDHIARRDAARKRFEEKRNADKGDKNSSTQERATAIREKDKATMDMFQQLAKQRFG
ncbi:hypothetical protein SERLA73DRAFT_189439 [Serpula lacrymans var. lacrymans S7.3]|uniref:Uncharacterized protein n=2 Tax=Serpula lacrymans var. lacrymans TaxID=341189 RepID=F8QDN2_SERL3|nr:uncharacterized protein SERLADRAFT_480253 [Serpula lacrymans var. lacrymans S7.9]EGN93703.1 hypothetical protein SERLA73DRAFT_189439 [Serpula lacrymans var. lacrymans S7.3]EGO19073.1 hypothetical protein SERLADRAFT_480253 [Serpula lacrymans var. lacrymans S7.9]